MAPGSPDRTADADLHTTFENRDDHDVGDRDAGDQARGNRAEPNEQAGQCFVGRPPGMRASDGRLTWTASGCAGLTVAGSTSATSSITRIGSNIDGRGRSGRVVQRRRHWIADNRRPFEVRMDLHGVHDAENGEPGSIDVHPWSGVEVFDAEDVQPQPTRARSPAPGR